MERGTHVVGTFHCAKNNTVVVASRDRVFRLELLFSKLRLGV